MAKRYNVIKTKDDTITNISISITNDFSLFRYRPVNEYSLNALIYNELWSSRPDTFNDPYDTSFVINEINLIDYALSKLDKFFFLNYAKQNNIDSTDLKKIAREFITNLYSKNLNTYKKLYMVVCFSEDVFNEAMWAHYANNGKGFAIEYNYNDIYKLRNDFCNYFVNLSNSLINDFDFLKDYYNNLDFNSLNQFQASKVYYKNKKYDGTELLKMAIDAYVLSLSQSNLTLLDLMKFYKEAGINIFDDETNKIMSDTVVYTKNKIWEYENEWRLLLPNPIIEFTDYNRMYYNVGFIYPKAVYIGEFISNPNKIVIYNHCYINGIKLYEMYSDLNNKNYKLNKKEISNEQMKSFLDNVGKLYIPLLMSKS